MPKDIESKFDDEINVYHRAADNVVTLYQGKETITIQTNQQRDVIRKLLSVYGERRYAEESAAENDSLTGIPSDALEGE